VLYATDNEPKSDRDAIHSTESKLWKDPMVKEMESLHKNETWDLVEIPNGRKPICRKWVFNKKFNASGQVEKFKARVVVKGYSQVEGVGFSDIFSHVAKLNSIRVLMYLAATFDLMLLLLEIFLFLTH
jgi:hypothetical protein